MPVEVLNRTSSAARGAPTTIDTLFVPMLTGTAGLPTDRAVEVRSLADYEAAGGTRAMNTLTYDGLDNFFREGGRKAYVARYLPPVAPSVTSRIPEALALFTESLGGGQVVAWDEPQAAATYALLQDHAAAVRRFALLDVGTADDTVALMTAKADAVPVGNDSYGAIFGPWVNIPGQDGVVGAGPRRVPASSTAAALIARADALGNPNRAPAGRDFPLQYASGLGLPMSDVNATTLRNAGLNPFRVKFGLMVLDGFQTSIAASNDTPFWQANCSRARMWLQWNALSIGLNYEFKPIDGRGRLARAFATDLAAMCLELYAVDGLYGDTPGEAFAVEVGVSVNTAASIAAGELRAVVEARFSLHAKTVIIYLVSVPVSGRVTTVA